ncbi:MAG: potassium/proton antiporter [Muribaculaceae bacterium]|nr:potassium/proton antiporter [Muribaculaceae bacterium]
MEITPGNIMLIVAVLLFLSVWIGKAGSRYGMPALLLFLGVGMLAGVDGFGLQFDNAATAEFIGMISLSIILFSGGLDTDFRQIRPVLGPGLVLATAGVLITTVLTGAFIYAMMHSLLPEYAFGWPESLLLAAIMSSTDSASVFSILNSSGVSLRQKLKPTLELESGSNDPMAYLLVVLLISVIESGAAIDAGLVWHSVGRLLMQLAAGAAGGIAVGLATVWVVNRLNSANEFLYPVLLISCCFFSFTLTDLIGGNSYLAVYIAGLVAGNRRMAMKRTVTSFFGGFTWLVQILMFLTLGLLVNPHELLHIVWPGLLLGIFMILVARPVAVLACLAPFRRYTAKARTYICWVGLRGAVPIIFATYALMSPAVEHARFMFNLVFFITILSLLLQGTTVNAMARWLGLTEKPEVRHFNIDLPEEVTANLREMTVTPDLLTEGDCLAEITALPPDTLVMLIKRGDAYLVPDGSTRLHLADTLLLISKAK